MKMLSDAPNRRSESTSTSVTDSVRGAIGYWNTASLVRLHVRGRLPVGDHEHDRLRIRLLAHVPTRKQQRVMQIRTLLPGAF